MAISALSLRLDGAEVVRTAAGWRGLIHTAFEHGVNAFEIVRPSGILAQGVAEAMAAVERRLVFLALRLTDAADTSRVIGDLGDLITRTGVNYLDLVSVEQAERPGVLPDALRMLKDEGRARTLGVAGEGDAVTAHVEAGAFDTVITSFSLLSGWRERHTVRTAMDRHMAVIGCDPFPPEVSRLAEAAHVHAKPGWFSKPVALKDAGSYAFLDRTQGWTSEQICVAYAMTEPSLASVQICVEHSDDLEALTGITERDLPAAVSAQIEMARFSAEREAGTERRATRRSA
jgi:aryl-alcohol dehydrogenase-like predicted oxidoreductase